MHVIGKQTSAGLGEEIIGGYGGGGGSYGGSEPATEELKNQLVDAAVEQAKDTVIQQYGETRPAVLRAFKVFFREYADSTLSGKLFFGATKAELRQRASEVASDTDAIENKLARAIGQLDGNPSSGGYGYGYGGGGNGGNGGGGGGQDPGGGREAQQQSLASQLAAEAAEWARQVLNITDVEAERLQQLASSWALGIIKQQMGEGKSAQAAANVVQNRIRSWVPGTLERIRSGGNNSGETPGGGEFAGIGGDLSTVDVVIGGGLLLLALRQWWSS